jgi:hypothetical protein
MCTNTQGAVKAQVFSEVPRINYGPIAIQPTTSVASVCHVTNMNVGESPSTTGQEKAKTCIRLRAECPWF